LSSLSLHFSPDFTGPTTASKFIIAAADSGSRCLEKVEVLHGCTCVTQVWCQDLQPILILNCQQKEYGHLFASILRATTPSKRQWRFARAVGAVDVSTLFEFLRRDEWEMLRLIQYSTSSLQRKARPTHLSIEKI
jgi:hypothetical protein